MSAQRLAMVRSVVPPQHQAAFDDEMAKLSQIGQDGALNWLEALKEFKAKLGLSINWACLFQTLPQAIAALQNPALWPGVLAAYFACASQPPTPAP